jgi:gamma-glutamylaminecyclotransferase
MTRLFVYGTLRGGENHHGLLSGARLVGPAITAPRYTLRAIGISPGLALNGDQAVIGELYDVGEGVLARLDRLAVVPGLHVRLTIALADGTEALANVVPEHHARHCPEIPGGDWVTWRRRTTRRGRWEPFQLTPRRTTTVT